MLVRISLATRYRSAQPLNLVTSFKIWVLPTVWDSSRLLGILYEGYLHSVRRDAPCLIPIQTYVSVHTMSPKERAKRGKGVWGLAPMEDQIG